MAILREDPLEILLKDVEALDVRFICIKQNEQWYLKHLRATRFNTEPSTPEQVCYASYLFLREVVSADKFLQLVTSLIFNPREEENKLLLESSINLAEELDRRIIEAQKRKRYEVKGFTINLGIAFISLSGHVQGHARWGLGHSTLPSWNFNGQLQPEFQGSTEPLVAEGAPFFPKAQDGEAWFLYNKSLESGQILLGIDIKIEDTRAYFAGIDIKGDTCIVRCQGKHLSETTINLYTTNPQVESKPAETEVVFTLQGRPKEISLALTQGEIWLDQRHINTSIPSVFGVPDDVNIVVEDDLFVPEENIEDIIANEGESMTLEFKSKLDDSQGKEKDRFLQSIVAFANTKGGKILLGVDDDGQVLGLDTKVTRETILNKIEDNISAVPYVHIFQKEIDGKTILVINVPEGTEKPYTIKANSNKPLYYIRRDGSNKIPKPEDWRQMLGTVTILNNQSANS